MSQVLPPLFIALSGLGLGLSILAFWQSVRGLLQAEPDGPVLGARSEARLALIDEKAALLKAIKELQFEREIGKISDQDYDALNARYRARAKQVLRDLDRQLGPHRKRAAAVVDQQLQAGTSAATAGAAPQDRTADRPESPQAAGAGTVEAQDRTGRPTDRAGGAEADRETPRSGSGEQAGRTTCAACGTSNETDAAFCKKCGQAITGNKA